MKRRIRIRAGRVLIPFTLGGILYMPPNDWIDTIRDSYPDWSGALLYHSLDGWFLGFFDGGEFLIYETLMEIL
jgi:hypothetical protein